MIPSGSGSLPEGGDGAADLQRDLILRGVRALGVTDPLHPSSDALRVVLHAHLVRRVLDEPTFRGYLGLVNPPLDCLLEALKAFSLDQVGIAHKAQDAIRLAIQTVSARLADPAIEASEARELRATLLDLVREARLESNEQRVLTLGFATLATSAFLAAVGGVVAYLETRRGGSAGSGPALPAPARRLLLK